MQKNNLYIRQVVIVVCSFLFFGIITHQSLHQLKHLEDVVCISNDKHFHANEHRDICKDLSFFPLSNFSDDDQELIIRYTGFLLNPLVIDYSRNFCFSLKNKSPPQSS
ncbi:MAG: hypothetical protein KatS3mg027_2241 [Bacteroidia bacterium]|nr:MAG: hypothetical protein KatS3mg027_2241 [Bacteroidia bacterium]